MSGSILSKDSNQSPEDHHDTNSHYYNGSGHPHFTGGLSATQSANNSEFKRGRRIKKRVSKRVTSSSNNLINLAEQSLNIEKDLQEKIHHAGYGIKRDTLNQSLHDNLQLQQSLMKLASIPETSKTATNPKAQIDVDLLLSHINVENEDGDEGNTKVKSHFQLRNDGERL